MKMSHTGGGNVQDTVVKEKCGENSDESVGLEKPLGSTVPVWKRTQSKNLERGLQPRYGPHCECVQCSGSTREDCCHNLEASYISRVWVNEPDPESMSRSFLCVCFSVTLIKAV